MNILALWAMSQFWLSRKDARQQQAHQLLSDA
jgi:hypothetical protein